ncbi:MAG: RsmB/NOP family class I SAM-dependent RNA methyltransferase [Candidatus Lokiarchaeota archaeon]|nr:RsmB/NOP family class I SAM-dependent RNA methyltransferase [Candidatus Lokiarchaeota archaeon]
MIERYVEYLGVEGTKALLEANEKPLIPSIRTNTIKISSEKLRNRLEKKDFQLKWIDRVPDAFLVTKEASNLGSTHEYLFGYYYLQNVASMLPALILDPQPGEIVVDMCAAPGSKSTQLAQLMNNEGTLVLIEKNAKRIPSLELNLRRMGVKNASIYNMDAVNLEKANFFVDKILLDAPCTGEGLIRQDPSRKTSKKFQDIIKLSEVQKRLLNAGLSALKPGGKLIYSTCSIAFEENEIVIDEVLRNKKNFKIKQLGVQYGSKGLVQVGGKKLLEDIRYSQRLYPHIQDSIGFYVCLIERLK